MSLLDIKSVNDVLRYVAKQRNLSTKASFTLSQIMNESNFLLDNQGEVLQSSYEGVTRKITELIQKYADLPTMQEFNQNTHLADKWVWGGSFGVSTLIGSAILKPWGDTYPLLKGHALLILSTFLREGMPTAEEMEPKALTEPLRELITFILTETEANQRKAILESFRTFTPVALASLEAYGLLKVSSQQNGSDGKPLANSIQTTSLGARVVAHLDDVATYLKEISIGYKTFSNQEPT